jgi:hypothetical protein
MTLFKAIKQTTLPIDYFFCMHFPLPFNDRINFDVLTFTSITSTSLCMETRHQKEPALIITRQRSHLLLFVWRQDTKKRLLSPFSHCVEVLQQIPNFNPMVDDTDRSPEFAAEDFDGDKKPAASVKKIEAPVEASLK